MEKDLENAKRGLEEILSGNRVTFVYEEDGQYWGEGSLVFQRDDPDYTIEGQRVYLSRLIVAPTMQNKGIGQKLLAFLMDTARTFGYEEISLSVDIENVGARWIYEKSGFNYILSVEEDEYGKYVKLLNKLDGGL